MEDENVVEERAPETTDTILESSKGKLQAVIVLGVDHDNRIVINTDNPNYQFMQWLISRSAFELNVHENKALASE